jgi:hypothetical protein
MSIKNGLLRGQTRILKKHGGLQQKLSKTLGTGGRFLIKGVGAVELPPQRL